VSVLVSRIVFNAFRNETSFISEIRCINNVFNSIAVMVTNVYYKDKESNEIIYLATFIKANGTAVAIVNVTGARPYRTARSGGQPSG
jgi:hypothetical protein